MAVERGIDIRQSAAGQLVFRASLKDSAGARLTAANTIRLRLFAVQSNGSLLSYDFNVSSPGFVGAEGTVPITPYVAMNRRYVSGRYPGIWTYSLATTGFTSGGIYVVQVSDETVPPTASPIDQEREFQYGGADGDVTMTVAGKVDANLTHTGGTAYVAGAIPAVQAGAPGGVATTPPFTF